MPRFIVHHIAQYLTEGKDAESVRQAAKDARLDVRWVEEVPDLPRRSLRGFALSQKPME